MSQNPNFERIRKDIRQAIQRALGVEARVRKTPLPEGLALEIAASPSARGPEIRRCFRDTPPLALVAFDTPEIQKYLFRARRPVDLLGGSSFVADFTDPEEPTSRSLFSHLEGSVAIRPESVIYAGGGGGLLLVAACEAPGLVGVLEEILYQETNRDLRTIATHLPVWPEELANTSSERLEGAEAAVGDLRQTSKYSATLGALMGRLQRRRSDEVSLAAPIPPERYIERCQACGRQVGFERQLEDGSRERICQGCGARRKRGSHQKKELAQAKDFEIIVESLAEDSLAVLWADGANVGRAFQRVRSPEQHRALSLAVDAAMNSVVECVGKVCPWLEGEGAKRWQTPLRGGDDLVLILPAIAALQVLVPMIDAFEGAFGKKPEGKKSEETSSEARSGDLDLAWAFEKHRDLVDQIRRFGLGIGLVMAPHKFPIQLLVDYSSQLLKSAKGRIDPAMGVRSAVDFMVLHSGTPLSKDIEALRTKYWHRDPRGDDPGLLLTGRPYTRDGMAELLERTRLLGQVGPTQLHAICREIDQGHTLSRSLWRYQHARAKEGEGWSRYRQALGCELKDVDSLLWRDQEEGWKATDLLDCRELFDLVLAAERENARRSESRAKKEVTP